MATPPIDSRLVSTQTGDSHELMLPRRMDIPFLALPLSSGKHRLTLEEGSHACILIPAPSKALDAHLSIDLQQHSSLALVSAHARMDAQQRCAITVRQQAGSTCNVTLLALGTRVQYSIRSSIEGESCASDMVLLSSARDADQQHLVASQHYLAPRSRGTITMKSVASGSAQLTSLGKIDIGISATGTDSFLTQHVLALDPTTVINATPALHIATNDVRASHAATVTNVSAEDLFYMTSRGLAEAEARALAIGGFLGELLPRIPFEEGRRAMLEACTQSGVPLGNDLA